MKIKDLPKFISYIVLIGIGLAVGFSVLKEIKKEDKNKRKIKNYCYLDYMPYIWIIIIMVFLIWLFK